MTSVLLYSRERIEELRSRISLLKCSLDRLMQNYGTISNTFILDGMTPPFIYPKSTFQKLGSRLNDLVMISEHVNPDSLPETVYQSYLLDVESSQFLYELTKLQNVLAQRICSLGMLKLLEFQENFQVEYGTITKAYNAVDALTFELVERILGSNWITENSYTPISLFDSTGYAINIYSNIISVPYYDSFRARFWPALAHEVAHIFVKILADKKNAFSRTMLDGISRLLEILDYRFDDIEGLQITSLQLTELTCDIVAAYACPASVLSACSILGLPFEEENAEGALIDAFRNVAHPPTDARITLMKEVLKETGILEADNEIDDLLSSVTMFLARKNFSLLSNSSNEFILEYNDFAKNFSKKILSVLPSAGVRVFKGDEWSYIRELFEKPSKTALSPVQLICMDWIKRVKVTKNDGRLLMHVFADKRKGETKIYEEMVDSMYDYYESKIQQSPAEVS